MDLYREYRDNYVAMRRAKAKCDDLKPRLISYVGRHDGPVKKPFGTFSIREDKKYTYSTKVKDMEEALAKLKEDERKKGVAKALRKQTLLFLAR